MRTRLRLFPLACLPALLVAVGCDSGPKVVKISGTATHKGEPVPSLLIKFVPDSGRPSWGITDKDGKYTLEYDETKKGAMVGKHTVSARFRPNSPEEEMGMKKPHPATKAVGDKYGDEMHSPMKIEVTAANENLELKFD
jgi:hypothetical protein